MKPDFNAMSRAELLAYLKEHRTDDEAWGIFSRSAQPQCKASILDEEGMRIMEEASRQNSRDRAPSRVKTVARSLLCWQNKEASEWYRHTKNTHLGRVSETTRN